MGEEVRWPEDVKELLTNDQLWSEELTKIEAEVAILELKIQQLQKKALRISGVTVLLLVGGIVAAVFREVFFGTGRQGLYDWPSVEAIVAITITLALFLLMYGYVWYSLSISPLRRRYEQLHARRIILQKLSPKKGDDELPQDEETYFDKLVQINVSNLAQYYTLVKVHTDNSFKASLVTGLVGFTLIALGLLYGFFSHSSGSATISYIATGSGVITEFIAGTFFFLYNRTVRQLKDYHDSLILVQNILLSFKIIGDLSDESDKAQMVSKMLASLVHASTQREKPSA